MKLFYTILLILVGTICSYSQPWVQRDSMPGGGIFNCFSFSIGGKLYVGGGYNGTTVSDLYEYDPFTNSWTTKASTPAPVEGECGFVLNDKGYVVSGYNGNSLTNSVYCYNPVTNTWTTRNNFPGTPRQNAACFSVNGYGFIFGGFIGGSSELNDMWQYNDTTDSWVQKANCPGPDRDGSFSMVINNQAYVGMGGNSSGTVLYRDLYHFDPLANSYTAIADFPVGRTGVSFSINSFGYVGLGSDSTGACSDNFWQYDPGANSWAPAPAFTGSPRSAAFSQVVNGVPYIGCGANGSTYFSDLWSYGYAAGIGNLKNDNKVYCYPSPNSGRFYINTTSFVSGSIQITIHNELGQEVYQAISDQEKVQVARDFSPGIYTVTVTQGTHQEHAKVVVE